ncbi:Radical SAM superfamily protein [uncultured archaeon]|nr:Radical SAM superfamily protein [uncultured archaeon]
METKEINVKSCLVKSKLSDYVINPYLGCQHGCKYCYATFMKRFQNVKGAWGEFCYARVNCPELLAKELDRAKPGHIWMSSVTDAYQPLEGKYRLTRRILEVLANHPRKDEFSIEILTKSALIRRDFDLIKRLNAEIGCSINTLDAKTARIIEPFGSPPSERVGVLKDAKKEGIKVYGFISPVIPGITKLEEIFRELGFCEYVWVELLNTKPDVMARLMPVIRENFPDAVDKIEFYVSNPELYYKEMEMEVRRLEKKYRLPVKDIVVH